MSIHLLTVRDVCNIEGRGVLAVGDWHEEEWPRGQVVARVGDAIDLRLPSGRRLLSKIEAITSPHREILLSKHITVADVERDTEIWTADS